MADYILDYNIMIVLESKPSNQPISIPTSLKCLYFQLPLITRTYVIRINDD